jgi:hypothetical protein
MNSSIICDETYLCGRKTQVKKVKAVYGILWYVIPLTYMTHLIIHL